MFLSSAAVRAASTARRSGRRSPPDGIEIGDRLDLLDARSQRRIHDGEDVERDRRFIRIALLEPDVWSRPRGDCRPARCRPGRRPSGAGFRPVAVALVRASGPQVGDGEAGAVALVVGAAVSVGVTIAMPDPPGGSVGPGPGPQRDAPNAPTAIKKAATAAMNFAARSARFVHGSSFARARSIRRSSRLSRPAGRRWRGGRAGEASPTPTTSAGRRARRPHVYTTFRASPSVPPAAPTSLASCK